MHHVGTVNEAAFQVPPGYEQHSQEYFRIALVDHTTGAVHMGLGLCKLEPGGTLHPHVHAYEESFFLLAGQVVLSLDGRAYQLGPGDYGLIPYGVPHAWRGIGEQPARWLEMLAIQPKPPGGERDTFFMKDRTVPTSGSLPDFRDLRTRYLGHFSDEQMPPPSQLQQAGYRGSNIYGISLKMLIDHMNGAQHLTLFMVEFQPGGDGNIHDHPFEESYFLLSGEAETILDGKTYHVKAGDYVWTSVGGTHGFFNRGNVPVRWIETQAPQPPNQQAFRFPSEWKYLAEKLEAE
ncbi:MAG TPA: cupin domain-containing protein [Ktedonobacteraceae bacterium]|jgi:quercetin dioxygenase-like cupin family protein|nr:cupin domain-containing protein [Ktedonobacteraceae bacterium]